MNRDAVVLLIGESRTDLDEAIEASRMSCPLRVVRVRRAATACARMAGGGVDAVLLRVSSTGESSAGNIAILHRAASRVPILALCDPGDEASGEAAVRSGAAAYLSISQCQRGLSGLLEAAIEGQPAADNHEVSDRGPGTILALLGAKGGVGTTTLAVNAASLLAKHHRVILVELRTSFGSLCHHFRPRRSIRNLTDLPAAHSDDWHLESWLWQYSAIPGLRVLFAPPGAAEIEDFGTAHVNAVLTRLSRMADYVVADLDASLPAASRGAIQCSSLLALVLERDPICLESAKARLEALDRWNIMPQLAGAAVVNRTPLGSPFEPAVVESQLGIPLFAMIPPAPELCILARQERVPLVVLDPESLAAGSIDRFTSHLNIRADAAVAAGRAGSGPAA